MDIEIIDNPIRFRLHGLSASVDNRSYGEVGCRLMDRMWEIVKGAGFASTGVNHWVYFAQERMFVGVQLTGAGEAGAAELGAGESLEVCECELSRYARHVHIGPYHELPKKWESLRGELAARGETITMPSLEVYGHSCEGDDGSQAETTILIGLEPRAD